MPRDFTAKTFAGSTPRREPHLVPVEQAARAVDCRLESGALDSWRTPRPLYTVPEGTKSVYQTFGCCWLTSTKCAHWAEGSVEQRHVFATQYNDYAYPVRIVLDDECAPTVYRLGLPCPTTRPTTNLPTDTGSKLSGANKGAASRHYAYQFEDSFGQRSSLSEPSLDVMVTDGSAVMVSGWLVPSGWDIQNVIILRTAEGFDSATQQGTNALDATWMEVARVSAAALSYVDSRKARDLDDALIEDVVTPPPADLRGMTWIRSMNCLAGFVGRELWFSENNQYHNWAYRLLLDDAVKAIVESNGTIYVATDGAPYVVTGASDCANAGCRQAIRLSEPQPLVGGGFRSMVALPSGAVYPTHQGLVYLSGNRAPVILSAQHYGQEDWHALHPDTMRGAYFEGRLYLFFRMGAFCLAIREGAGTAAETDHHTSLSLTPDEVFVSRTGRLLFRTGTQVSEWDRGDQRMPHYYEGALLQTGVPFNFGALQLVLDPLGPETVQFIVDEFVELNETAHTSEVFTLPMWATGQRFQWVLAGTGRVTRIGVAPSLKELA